MENYLQGNDIIYKSKEYQKAFDGIFKEDIMKSNFELFYLQNIIYEIFPIIAGNKDKELKKDLIEEKINTFNAKIPNINLINELNSLIKDESYEKILQKIYRNFKTRFDSFYCFINDQSTILGKDTGNVKLIISHLKGSIKNLDSIGNSLYREVNKISTVNHQNIWGIPEYEDIKSRLDSADMEEEEEEIAEEEEIGEGEEEIDEEFSTE